MQILGRLLTNLATILALELSAVAQSSGARFDLLLKNGHMIDPANHIDNVMNVAISKNKIATVQKEIPATEAGKVVDVSDLYVTPNLINIHFHIGHGDAPLNWF